MRGLTYIFLSSILTENYVLSKFLGICPFLGVSKKIHTAVGMSIAVTFVMVLSTAVTWPVYQYFLLPNHCEYLQIVVFILIIASLVQIVELILKRFIPALYTSLGVYLPLITTNCAVLGITILVIERGAQESSFDYLSSLVNAFGAGVGFLVAMVLFSGIRGRLEDCNIPQFMKGLPITLVAASIVSLSFFGFQGVLDHIMRW